MRSGHFDEAALEEQLNNRGFMNRILGRLMKSITTKPWQMYPLGLLFGLGFDTATEIALLILAGTGAASGLPWYAILCLPILFAAGMSLLDTIDRRLRRLALRPHRGEVDRQPPTRRRKQRPRGRPLDRAARREPAPPSLGVRARTVPGSRSQPAALSGAYASGLRLATVGAQVSPGGRPGHRRRPRRSSPTRQNHHVRPAPALIRLRTPPRRPDGPATRTDRGLTPAHRNWGR